MNPVTETVTDHWQEPQVTNKSHGALARATGHEHKLQATSKKGRSVEA